MSESKKEILIIACFFKPDKRVGALRATYWFNNLGNSGEFSVSLLTAQENAEGRDVHIVPIKGSSLMRLFIQDEGVIWRKNIKAYLLENEIKNPDCIIITGTPFMQFGLTSWLKKRYSCKVILDYRDPFAVNPGFDNNRLKVLVKKAFERSFNKQADALVTVNGYCANIIELFHKKPNAIVQNGYDESVQPILSEVNLSTPSFSYMGKFYFDPAPIVNAMIKTKSALHYAGPDSVQLETGGSSCIVDHGFVTYQEAVDLIAKNDVGIVQTYGEDFQSTTKLFDYIRCKKAILIVSDNFIERGSIHEELEGYPNVFWSKNDEKCIVDAIEKIKKTTFVSPESEYCEKFSRGKQMENLTQLLNQILDE